MKPEELASLRLGVESSQLLPFLRAEVELAQKAIVNTVSQAVTNGTLTPDMAQSKWIEYIAYFRMLQRFSQRSAASLSIAHSENLDFNGKSA